MAAEQGVDIPNEETPFVPPNIPRSTRKEGASSMLPFRHDGRALMLSVQLEQDMDGNLTVCMDIEESVPRVQWDDASGEASPSSAEHTAAHGHFCTFKLNPDRILTAARGKTRGTGVL